MTVKQAIEELKQDISLYETDICKPGDGTPDGDLMEALTLAISALEQQTGWISVDDALPDVGMRVLTIGVRGGIQICRYDGLLADWNNFFYSCERKVLCPVTHWMPLPKPPEVKE